MLAVTEKGFGKRVPVGLLKVQKRRGKGTKVLKFKAKAGNDGLRALRLCRPGDDIVISTMKGTVIRQKVDDIRSLSRKASGVVLQDVDEDDAIVMVDVVPPDTKLEEF